MAEEKERRVSYWQVFFDDWGLLFFFSAAILVILYTIWGAIELGSLGQSPLEVAPAAQVEQAAPATEATPAPEATPPAAQ